MSNPNGRPVPQEMLSDVLPYMRDSSSGRCGRCGKRHGDVIEFSVEIEFLGLFQVGATCAKKLAKAGWRVEAE